MLRLIGIVLWTTCLVRTDVFAQDQTKVDSLNLLLERQVGCERFEALYELCFEYIIKDNIKALHFIQQAEIAALSSYDSLWIVKSKRVKAAILYYLERNDEVLQILEEVLPIAQRNGFKTECSSIHQFSGRVYLFEGHYDKALSFFLERLQLAKELDDMEELSSAWHDVGICYYKLRDYDQAMQYYFKSWRGYQSLSIRSAIICTNIALCYANLGELNRAKDFIADAIQISKAECPDKCQVNLKYAMGLVATLENDYNSAEAYLLESYEMAKRHGDTRFQLDNIYLLAEIFMERKDFGRAQRYLTIAENLMEQTKSFNLEMIKIYSRFSEVYIDLQDFKKASSYQSKYIALRDSIYREELTNSLMKVQSDYMERENKAKITAQAEIIDLSREVVDGQRKLTLAIGTLAALVAVILIFVVCGYQQKRKLNKLLEKKVRERTIELESGRNELMLIVKEQELILEHASSAIRQKLKTINGLCKTAEADLPNPRTGFFVSRIQNTLQEIEEGIESTQAQSQLTKSGRGAFMVDRFSKIQSSKP